ncbi:MAG: RNA methyltransferase [Leptospiraceae bacterium]|nr:RNA methyltransferase [Leptospiraceae bacterium]
MKELDSAAELVEYLEGFLTGARKERIREILGQRTRYITPVLEDLVDPHNSSACLRSAEACGLQDVHIIENRHAFQVKSGVSMGSAHWLTLRRYRAEIAESAEIASIRASATERCFATLREEGYIIYATTPHRSSISLPEMDLSRPAAIVFGSEKDGISAYARENADHCLQIPMYGFTESFNISVCAAITLYSLSQKLRQSEIPWQLSESQKQHIRLQWARHSLKRSDLLEANFRTIAKKRQSPGKP